MFHKVMFSSSAHGTTAGLVVDTEKVDVQDVAAVSRLYPWSACRQMSRYHVSPAYVTWADAFAHVFDVDNSRQRCTSRGTVSVTGGRGRR